MKIKPLGDTHSPRRVLRISKYALAPYMHNLENQRKSHQKSGKYFLASKRDAQIKECE